MSLILLCIIFFLGACMGSFGAVLIEFDGNKRSFWRGRSHCNECGGILQWYELIPLFSYPLQRGECRKCHASIPRWIWYTEWYMAFLWLILSMIFSLAGFSWVATVIHLIIISGLFLLVMSDTRTRIIPDTVSIPLIAVILICSGILIYFPQKMLLPSFKISIMGAFVGMMFYMVQMMIPAIIAIIHRKTYRDIGTIMLAPVLFLMWMIVRIFIGEKRADSLFPSLRIFEELPSWVGGGDIRLGFIIGLLTGPYDFLTVIMYGYVGGTVFFLI